MRMGGGRKGGQGGREEGGREDRDKVDKVDNVRIFHWHHANLAPIAEHRLGVASHVE